MNVCLIHNSFLCCRTLLLRSIPSVEQILALVILYEIHDIKRFPTVLDFSSYARLIRPVKESDNKWAGHSNKKIGNHHQMFGADALSSDSLDRRRKPKPTSRLSRNLIRRRKIYSLLFLIISFATSSV
jgi:hypothetical protein